MKGIGGMDRREERKDGSNRERKKEEMRTYRRRKRAVSKNMKLTESLKK